MTAKQSSWWLEGMAKKKGISVDEMRALMAERGAKSSAHSSFVKNTPEQRKAISMKGVAARAKKREEDGVREG